VVIEPMDTGFNYRLIEDVKGQYGISQIIIADITGDNKTELITSGNRYIRIYTRSGDSWKVFCDEKIRPGQITVGDVNNDQHPDLIVSGKDGLKVYNFRDIPFVPITSRELITTVIKPADLIGK